MIAPRLPKPDRMSPDDWVVYLRQAVKRETGRPWQAAAWEVKDWSRRLRDAVGGADPFVMALSVDVMAMNWGYEKTLSPQRALSHVRMLRWYYDMRRPRWFWRAVWFSRYAETHDEAAYYDEWLAQAEAALDTGEGRTGRKELMVRARVRLREAEAELAARGGPPAFKYDWLGQRRDEICRQN